MSKVKEDKSFPFIEGDRIYLCTANIDNINLYTKWMNNPKIRKYARYEMPLTVEEVKKYFEPTKEEVKTDIFFEIWHKNSKNPIGYTGFIRINWFTRSAHIFFLIGDIDYWGQNIATEAGQLVINYGFEELNLHKIVARVFSPNKASLRVVEKLGFNLEITLKKEIYIDGEFVDAFEYIIIKE
jgi:RimJ/RimL family protein N-acetyltransferase